MQGDRVYLSPPHLTGEEHLFVEDALASNWIAPLGPHVDAFEREVCQVAHVAHAVAVASGTAALHLALEVLGVSAGDDVVCSSLTFSASANPIRYQRANPVFIDSDASWTMDPNLLEDALRTAVSRGRLPKAAIVVDLYGQCADYDSLVTVCERYGVPLIEDAAEALGSTFAARPAGGFGRLGVFSFNGNKIITTSGGGMLLSHEMALIERARYLSTQARQPAAHYEHTEIGYNYRLSNVLAAIGRGQLAGLSSKVEARRALFVRYQQALQDIPGVTFMAEAPKVRANRWLTCITVDPGISGVDRETLRLALEAENIEARPVWKPMHLQPVFRDAKVYGGAVSERLFQEGLCLPSGSALTPEDQRRVVSVIRQEFNIVPTK